LFEVASLNIQNTSSSISDNKRIYALQDEYIKTIDPVIAFARKKSNLGTTNLSRRLFT
jgi:hypothetical protein